MTAPATSKPAFRKGDVGMEAAAAQRGGGRRKTHYLSSELSKDGEQVVVRFATESPDWIWVQQHNFVPCRPAPAGINQPKSMTAVCRHDEAFQAMYSDCVVCDTPFPDPFDKNKPFRKPIRAWAVACIREPVVGTAEMVAAGKIPPEKEGKTLGYRDKIREIDELDKEGNPTGKKIEERAMVLVNYASDNFFGALQGMYGVYGSNCDRDYVIKRKGGDQNTDYQIVPLDPIPGLAPGTESWKRYTDAIKEQGLDLEEFVANLASDDFYARFIDPNKPFPGGDKIQSNGNGQAAPQGAPLEQQNMAPSGDAAPPDEDRRAAMAARVRAHVPGAQQGAETPADGATPETPASAVPPAAGVGAGAQDFG